MREEVVRLGQARAPWAFLPVCWQVLRAAPGDMGLRLLAAANLARLGLKTAALEELRAARDAAPSLRSNPPSQSAEDPDALEELRMACERLPEDRMGAEALAAMCLSNLEVVTARGVDAARHFEAWLESARADDWFRALDGNVVRRRCAEPREWVLFGDHRGAAEQFAAQHLATGPAHSRASVIPRQRLASLYTVEGVNPPWLLMQMAAHTRRQSDGFWPRLLVVQADPMEFLDGLACADLRDVLSEERIRLFIGRDAAAQLAADLRGRMATQLSGLSVPLATTRTRAGAPAIIEQAQAEQLAEHRRLVREVREVYAGRDRMWWRARYAEATGEQESAGELPLAPCASPLRILVPTTRYSTYLQHSSSDLVEALNQMGFEARLLIEPDESSRMSSLAYLRSFNDFQPDLVVLTNYFRSAFGECIPAQAPVVCWVQDAMPHHFGSTPDPGGAADSAPAGELDFIVGHLHRDLLAQCRIPSGRALPFPVTVSSAKFHSRPVNPLIRGRYDCDIALVSHHGEPPERMHQRLVQEAASPGAPRWLAPLLENLYPLVVRIGEDPMGEAIPATRGGPGSQWARLRSAVAHAMRQQLGREIGENESSPIFARYALPLAERALRHQTVRWAAELARRRGWRLALYGRGWEDVDDLAEFACGEARHGEDLRAIYQCARVQLHISATALVHQRVMECALSGGLPVCRLTGAEVEAICRAARERVMLDCRAQACDLASGPHGALGFRVADHPALMGMIALMQRLGLYSDTFAPDAASGHQVPNGQRSCWATAERDGIIWTTPRHGQPAESGYAGDNLALERCADWVYGDLAQVTFRSPEELERIVERAMTEPAWRTAMSSWIAQRVRARLTHETLMKQMLRMIRGSFESPGDPSRACHTDPEPGRDFTTDPVHPPASLAG